MSTFWTKERLMAEASLYATRNEWREHSFSSYMRASQLNLIDECCQAMERLRAPKNYWTLEQCQADALKYTSRSEWYHQSRRAYSNAVNNDWLDLCCAHMKPSMHKMHRGYWQNKENVLAEAKKYTSRYEFSKNAQTAYLNARKGGYLEEACQHMG
jgi:hypothetical protein